MKHKFLKPFTFVASVTLTLTMANPANAARIAFVRNPANAISTDPFDEAWVARLGTQGHTVEILSQATTAAAAASANYDLFIVSQDVGGATFLAGVGVNQPKPMLVYEPAAYNSIFGATAAGNPVVGGTITISDPLHPLSAGLSGDVLMYSAAGNMPTFNPTLVSSGTKVLATNTANAAQGTFAVLEAGAVGSGGAAAPAIRIGLPCFDNWAVASVTADAWKLLDNAVAYVLPAAVNFDHLAVATTASNPQTVNVPFDVTITAQDGSNATVTTASGTVSMNSTNVTESTISLMEFDWNSDGTFGDNSGTLNSGVKTIKARNKKAETATIVASAGSATTLEADIPFINTVAGAFAKLQILAPGEVSAPGTTTGKTTTPPTAQVRGVSFNVAVNAVDEFWNGVAAPSNTIAITASDPLAGLPVARPLDNPGPEFGVTLNSLGAFTVTATDSTDGSKLPSTTALITVKAPPVIWAGNGTLNQWDLVTPNWVDGTATATLYADTAQVTFNDSGSNSPAVDIVGTLSPERISVISNKDYTIGSTSGGSISGAALGIFKDNAGTLTLTTANTYTGQTNITEGILIIGHADAVPSTSNLRTDNGVVIGLAAGDFTRTSGQGANQINLNNNSGFAAYGANRIVNIGGASAKLVWGANDFGGSGTSATIVFGATTADASLDFQNPLSLTTTAVSKTFSVRDGTAAVDAILSGAITDGNNNGFIKSGAGTLKLSSPDNAYSGPTTITGGTLALGASGVIPDTSNIFIGAATLDAETFTDTLGTLDVTAASTLNLGSGGKLAFADSMAVDWTGGTLAITGSFVSGSSLRFGTTNSGLTSTQLGLITVNGSSGPFTLTRSGFLSDGTIGDPYDTWSGGAAFDADSNNDGVENGLAWLLGATTKDVNALGFLPKPIQTGGGLQMTFSMLNEAGRGGALLQLQHSNDLGINDPWTSVTVPETSSTVGGVTFVITPGSPLNSVQATIPSTEAKAGKLFGRAKGEK